MLQVVEFLFYFLVLGFLVPMVGILAFSLVMRWFENRSAARRPDPALCKHGVHKLIRHCRKCAREWVEEITREKGGGDANDRT